MNYSKLKQIVLARDAGICVIHGPNCTVEATEIDHRAGRQAGGSKALNVAYNLIASCHIDNVVFKENAVGFQRARLVYRGLRLAHGVDVSKTLIRALHTPVLYPDGSWYLLDEQGYKTSVREGFALEQASLFNTGFQAAVQALGMVA